MLKIIFILLLSLPSLANAAGKYWVDPSGNDANTCSVVNSAIDPGPGRYKKTWQSVVSQCFTPGGGNTLHAKAGTYTDSNNRLNGLNSAGVLGATAKNPNIFEGDGVGLTIYQSFIYYANGISNTIFQDFEIDGSWCNGNCGNGLTPGDSTGTGNIIRRMRIHHHVPCSVAGCGGGGISADSSFVQIYDNEIDHNGAPGGALGLYHGVYWHGDDALITHNHIHHNTDGAGIQCYVSTSDNADRCTITRNLFEDNQAHIYADGTGDVIENNIFIHATAPGGVSCGYSACSGTIANNVFYNNVGEPLYIGVLGGGVGGSNTKVQNNLFFGNTGNAVRNDFGATNVTISFNACTSGDSCGSTGKVPIAAVTDCTISTSNFHLKSGTNPCRDAGTTITGLTNDYDGVTRPQGAAYDIGACENSGALLASPQNLKVQ